MNIGKKIFGFWQLLRIKPVLSWGVSAFLLGSSVAWMETNGSLDIFHGFLGLLLVLTAQGYASHGLNDAFDWVTGTDKKSIGKGTGGSRVIPEGYMSLKQTVIIGIIATMIDIIIGVYLITVFGIPLILLTVIAVLAPILYSVPPFKLAYRPFNEIVTVLPALTGIVVGSTLVLSGSISIYSLFLGFIHSCFCISWFIISRLPDYEPDKSVGKITTVVYLGKEKTPMVSSFYASIGVIASIFGILNISLTFVLTPIFFIFILYNIFKLDPNNPTQASKIRLRNMHTTTVHALFFSFLIIFLT